MLDYVSIKMAVMQFNEKHGGDPVPFGDGFVLYADGAVRELNPIGILREPPEDKYEHAKLQLKYCEKKLSMAVDEFNRKKNNLLKFSETNISQQVCPPPSCGKEQLLELKELKRKVQLYQRNLEQARTNLENAKPSWMKEQVQTSEINRKKNRDVLDELNKIEI